MKKKLLAIVLVLAMLLSMTACSKDDDTKTGGTETGTENTDDKNGDVEDKKTPESSPTPTPSPTEVPPAVGDIWEQLTDGELKDGKFETTRKISVEIFDRGNDGGSDPTNNMYTDYIKKGMLEKHNVEVSFIAVPRWTETEQINNLLAANDAPDICYTYSYPTIQTYAGMGAVIDLGDMVEKYKEILPNMWNFLTDQNINYDKDPVTGELWAIEGKRANNNRIVTFIRQDWLNTLGLAEPTTTEEFYNVLKAFKDNAVTLLGDDADKMIPYSVSSDVGWRAATLIESFIDPEISDKEYYINGFDDRKYTQNGTKEAVRLLNKWYNEGLMWRDFIIYTDDNTVEDDMMKAGYVGVITHNWDYPFRSGEDGINANLKRVYGENASFVPIDPFTDKNGNHTKFNGDSVDRKIFFPATNEEPLASLLYIDFISSPEVIEYLQIGDEGVTHEKNADGAISILPATGAPIMNSGQNIDYTMTCNGLKLVDPEQTVKSLALSYAGIEPEYVIKADKIANTEIVIPSHVNVGAILSEEGQGEALADKRDEAYDNAVAASVEEFDQVWDSYMQEYLDMGGQAIIDERTEKWNEFYGSKINLK